MAGEEGFEPPNTGTKTQCLTTWPLPNNYLLINSINLFPPFIALILFSLLTASTLELYVSESINLNGLRCLVAVTWPELCRNNLSSRLLV